MSEYVTVEGRLTENANVLEIETNQTLSQNPPEVYHSYDEGDQGSPIAQMLFNGIDGIAALTIQEDTLIITYDPSVPWETIVDDVRDALRDFFL